MKVRAIVAGSVNFFGLITATLPVIGDCTDYHTRQAALTLLQSSSGLQ